MPTNQRTWVLAALVLLLGSVRCAPVERQPLVRQQACSLSTVQQVDPVTTLNTGDLIVAGWLGCSPKALYVLDTTLNLKGALLPGVCPVIVGMPATSPDGSTMTFACSWSDAEGATSTVVSVNLVDLSAANVTTLPANVAPQPGLQYRRTGSVLLPSITVHPENDNTTTKTIIAYNNAFEVVATYDTMDTFFSTAFSAAALDTGDSQILSVNQSNSVHSFPLVTAEPGPDVFTLPAALAGTSTCTGILTLWDGTAVVACSGTIMANGPGMCLYHAVMDVAGSVLRQICIPLPAVPQQEASTTQIPVHQSSEVVPVAATHLAMDTDRQFLFVATNVYGAAFPYPNMYKIRWSDFAFLESTTLPLPVDGVSVFGALPADQQDCNIGSKCCTAPGRIAPNGTLCRTSRDPCSHDSFCDGATARCPEPVPVADDTLCSLHPPGLFEPVHDSYSPGGEFSLTADQARYRGYHKCYCCQAGSCMPKQFHRQYWSDQYRSDRYDIDRNNYDMTWYRRSAGVARKLQTDVDVQGYGGDMHRDWVWCK